MQKKLISKRFILSIGLFFAADYAAASTMDLQTASATTVMAPQGPLNPAERTFDQSYLTLVLHDGDGDFYLGFKLMQCLASSLPSAELKKNLFLFLIQDSQPDLSRRIGSFREIIQKWLPSTEQKASNISYFVGAHPNNDFDLLVSEVGPDGQFLEPRFPTYAQQQTPALHLVGATGTQLTYKAWFGQLTCQINGIPRTRHLIFHGEMGSAIGMNRLSGFFMLLRSEVLKIVSRNTLEGDQAIKQYTDIIFQLQTVYQKINLPQTVEFIQALQKAPLIWAKLSEFIKSEALYLLKNKHFSPPPKFEANRFCGLGFGPNTTDVVLHPVLEQHDGMKRPAPGFGIFVSQPPTVSQEAAKEKVFAWVQGLRKVEPYRHLLSKTPQLVYGEFDPKNTHIVFCANSRPYALDIEAIFYAINLRFREEFDAASKAELSAVPGTKTRVLVILKHIPEDKTPALNAPRVLDHPLIRLLPISERIPDDLYRHLIRASLFFGAAGDNAIMDAFSLGTWPFPLYHDTLCKNRETMFPVASRIHFGEMARGGITAKFEPGTCFETLKLLGTNGKFGSEDQRQYIASIPTDQGLDFFRCVICPYILENLDYGQKLLEFHAAGKTAAEQLTLQAINALAPSEEFKERG